MNALELRNLALAKLGKSERISFLDDEAAVKEAVSVCHSFIEHDSPASMMLVEPKLEDDPLGSWNMPVPTLSIRPTRSAGDNCGLLRRPLSGTFDMFHHGIEAATPADTAAKATHFSPGTSPRSEGDRDAASREMANTKSHVLIRGALNVIHRDEASTLLSDVYHLLRQGGVLLAFVYASDEPIQGPTLVAGKVLSYVPSEDELLRLAAAEKFYGIKIEYRSDVPSVITETGADVRLFLLRGYKGKEGPCLDQGHAVMYTGPWLSTQDDDGHTYRRGERTAVCAKTFNILMKAPYRQNFIPIPYFESIPLDMATVFDCNTPSVRDPRVSKGYKALASAGNAAANCTEQGCC